MVEEWTGEFSEIISGSPVGDRTYGPYDVYIKTLMEIFPDELIDVEPFDDDIEKILHEFQKQNALSLRKSWIQWELQCCQIQLVLEKQ